jgi:hypothetical protein
VRIVNADGGSVAMGIACVRVEVEGGSGCVTVEWEERSKQQLDVRWRSGCVAGDETVEERRREGGGKAAGGRRESVGR